MMSREPLELNEQERRILGKVVVGITALGWLGVVVGNLTNRWPAVLPIIGTMMSTFVGTLVWLARRHDRSVWDIFTTGALSVRAKRR